MTKAENIYKEEFGGRIRNQCLYGRVLTCIDNTLEWAALKIEEFGECDCGAPKEKYNTASGHAMNCHYDVAHEIRAGKSPSHVE